MTQENVNNMIRTLVSLKREDPDVERTASEVLERYHQTNKIFADLQVLDLTNWMSANKRFARLNGLINMDTSTITDPAEKEAVEQLQNALTVMFKYIETPGAKINMGLGEPQRQMIVSLTQVNLADGQPVLSESDVNSLINLSLEKAGLVSEAPTEEDASSAIQTIARQVEANQVKKAWSDKQEEEQDALNLKYKTKFAEIDAYVNAESETLPALPE